MPTPDLIQGINLPDYEDAPAVPEHLADVWYAMIGRGAPRFANNAARSAAYPSPTLGQLAWTSDSSTLWIYTWVKLWAAADNLGWVAMTLPTNYAQLGGFENKSKVTRDAIFARGRIIRTATTTGTVTWANMPNSAHWPATVWELGGVWEPSVSTHVRAYVDADGGIKTAATPSTMTQLYFTSSYPRD
jgi:alkylation response protein AidB-like acyl-CoA dehydrogenase